jgi:hypothetical protein
MYLYTYMYIYIIHTYIHTHTHIHTYAYIHAYTGEGHLRTAGQSAGGCIDTAGVPALMSLPGLGVCGV